MTELQRMILTAVDGLGPMTRLELETACLIEPKQKGGFSTTLVGLYERGLLQNHSWQIALSDAGRKALSHSAARESAVSDKTEFAWVIEKGSGTDLKYYAPTAPGEWVSDHLKACRFARKEDAEAVQFRHVTHGHLPEYNTRVCEHGWG